MENKIERLRSEIKILSDACKLMYGFNSECSYTIFTRVILLENELHKLMEEYKESITVKIIK